MDEVCIVLDEDDNPIGSASKKVCTSILTQHMSPNSPARASQRMTKLEH